jgi:4-amino-4-deoxy-L-arabinose transferase-like glycosyltransferase
LPCALSGLLGVVLLMLLARRLYDGRTAVLAGLVLATSFGFVDFARTASSDMENVMGELAALVLFFRYEKKPAGPWLVGVWFVMALTSLTKGLLGFALPLLVLSTYSCLSDGRGAMIRGMGHGPLRARLGWLIGRCRWLFNRWSALGFLLAAAVYLGPFAVSWGRTGSTQGLYMVYRENVQRFFNAHNHRGPVYLYAYVIFGLMAPWSALLPAALVRAHEKGTGTFSGRSRLRGCEAASGSAERRDDRFARVYFWATFVFFTVSSSRRSYYLLPLLPACALLVGRLLAAPHELSLTVRRLVWLGCGVTAVAVALAGLALLPARCLLPAPWDQLPSAPLRPVLASCWLAAVAAFVMALRRFSMRRVASAFGASASVFLAYVFLVAVPAAETYRGEKALAGEALRWPGPDGAGLALYRTREPVFYLGLSEPVPEYDDCASLAEAVRDGRVSWVLARRRDLAEADVAAAIVSAERVFDWENATEAGNKLVLARLIRR